MNRRPLPRRTIARAVFLTCAALAVALKVLIPAGYMAAAEPRNALPFALVLCTGDGAKVVAPGAALDHRDDDPAKAPSDAPCPFAALAANGAPPPSIAAAAPVEFVAYAAAVRPKPTRGLAPGRGLAAPPLPARGPPSLQI